MSDPSLTVTANPVVALPLQHWVTGSHPRVYSLPLPADHTLYHVLMDGNADWPLDEGDVVAIVVDASFDNGATWQHDATLTLGGGAWHDRQGQPTTQHGWTVHTVVGRMPQLLRVGLDVIRPCSIGLTLTPL